MTPVEFHQTYGPVALVTGASSGIGAAFAEVLAEMGFDLLIAARRTDRLEALAARMIEEHGVRVTPLEVDLARGDAPQLLLDAAAAFDIGLVVSNAGFGLKGPHEANDPATMTAMLMVNCNVPMQLAHGFIPRLRARRAEAKGAGIIFTASIEGLMGCPYSAAYSATKALVIALGEALWGEVSGEGIDILTLCPGATESEAAANQGIDPTLLRNQLPAADVALNTLAHIADGPTFFSSDYYKANFDQLLALPKRDALGAMAAGMKPKG
jgi:short-subunit dehydrogenase